MRPFNQINIGDVYKSFLGSEWVVLQKDNSEKIIEVIMLTDLPPSLNYPIWKKNTDHLFNNRVLEAR